MKVNIYITSINKETYIGLKIDDFYFNNEDSGYHVKLNKVAIVQKRVNSPNPFLLNFSIKVSS